MKIGIFYFPPKSKKQQFKVSFGWRIGGAKSSHKKGLLLWFLCTVLQQFAHYSFELNP